MSSQANGETRWRLPPVPPPNTDPSVSRHSATAASPPPSTISVKAQLSALVERQTHGATSDVSALAVPKKVGAGAPQSLAAAAAAATGGVKGATGKAKPKPKQVSSRSKRRSEKLRDKAEALSGKLEVKVQAKEGRKVGPEGDDFKV